MTGIMRAAKRAAEIVATWSRSKQEYAKHIVAPQNVCRRCGGPTQHFCGMGACVDVCPRCDRL